MKEWVAGDLVNTPRVSSPWRPPEPSSWARSNGACRRPGQSHSARGRAAAQGQDRAGAGWAPLRVVAERGGRNRKRDAGGAIRRPRRGAPQLKDLFHAMSREKRARLVRRWSARPGSARPASPGSSRSTSTPRRRRRGGTMAAAPPMARDQLLGPGGDGPPACRLLETDDEPDPVEDRREPGDHIADVDEGAGSNPPSSRSWAWAAARPARSSSSRPWRTFFERLATTAPVVIVFSRISISPTPA